MIVTCLKLVTGEDLIARCTNRDADVLVESGSYGVTPTTFELQDIHVITMQQVAKGIAVTLIPYMLGDQAAKVTISAAHVIAAYPASKEIEGMFLTKTSPIQVTSEMPRLQQ